MLIPYNINSLQGEITLPGDKSISHRAIILSSISEGSSRIQGFLKGEDCLRTIDCFQKLGIDIEDDGREIIVHGKGLKGLKESKNILDVGNSGTTIRLISGILAGQGFSTTITGDESIQKRPMDRIIYPLTLMGGDIKGRDENNLAPLIIKGKSLKAIDYSLPIPSAQVKSAILLAGLYAEGKTIVREKVKSRDHTERMLKALGANIQTKGKIITLRKSNLHGQDIKVPGDISSAGFLIAGAAALPGSKLVLKDIGLNPTRTGIIDVLLEMGANIEIENISTSGGEKMGDIIVEGSQLKGINIGGEIIPSLIDEIPVIAMVGAIAEGKTIITGAEELRVKETDRISVMVKEMKKLGVKVKELPDGMEIQGNNKINGGIVESYGDHRIAMALAIGGLFANSPVEIKDSKCVDVSFPGFGRILKSIVR